MKNVKRLVAILTTAVLCMGMSMSAFAVEGPGIEGPGIEGPGIGGTEFEILSPSLVKPTKVSVDPDVYNKDNAIQGELTSVGQDKDGKPVETTVSVAKLKDEHESKLENGGAQTEFVNCVQWSKDPLPEDYRVDRVEMIFAGEFELKGGNAKVVSINFSIGDVSEDPQMETLYYALHGLTDEDGNIKWEAIPCNKEEDGRMVFTMSSFSPVAILKITMSPDGSIISRPNPSTSGGGSSSSRRPSSSSGTTTQPDNQLGNTTQAGTTAQIGSSEKKSPKTGEF